MTGRGGVAVALAVALLAGPAAGAEPRDLRAIARTGGWNDALACPAGICRAAADFESSVVGLLVEALIARARRVLANEPRAELVAVDRELHQLVFVQRSAVFGFPDTVWVQALATDGGAVAILYSRSTYGVWDFGVNRARVERWLDLLTAEDR